MARCEDFPCCGHESGDCPTRDSNGKERWTCVKCGKRLSLHSPSSICAKCLRRMSRMDDRALQGMGMGVVFPAYNEEENIRGTIARALEVLRPRFKRFEIIIVDDCGRDRVIRGYRSAARKNDRRFTTTKAAKRRIRREKRAAKKG